MATQIRQSNLFAAEDWKLVYESFRQISLQAYDYDTLREAMINHLRTTYPDNFNDWIGNQEFIFILDTLCFLGQNLAFRMDLNTRENFIDTAERRESILRLAYMLAYSPRRNYSSRGLVKVTEISTSQDVRDSNGTSLAGVTVKWNDPLNADWYEQFIIVLNANFVSSNPFGDPVKRLNQQGLQTHIYRLNTIEYSSIAEPFSAIVNGQTMNFEIVNPDTDDDGVIVERHPNPQESRYILYRNDGNGFNSPDTGFFFLFKQGTLKKDDFLFSKPLENRVLDIAVSDINEIDVWCQQITDNGVVSKKWTKVPSAQNIMYNSVSHQIKDIFSVITRDNDEISIRFPDSSSGNIPRGSYRIWYRVSNGQSYTIKTTDIQNKSITYSTRGADQTEYESSTINFKFSLQYQVQNAQAQETIEQIRVRAPQTYYTSNRLVTGEDYNIGPMRQGNLVKKAKAINRVYSGHSRFIDINDPTGKYQNTNVIADDGIIYRDDKYAFKRSAEVLPSNKPDSAIIAQKLQPLLSYVGLRQLYDEQKGAYNLTTPSTSAGYRLVLPINDRPEWIPDMNQTPFGSVGKLSKLLNTGIPVPGMLLKLALNTNPDQYKWVSVLQYDEYSTEVKLSDTVNASYFVFEYYAPLRTTFNFNETSLIIREMQKRTDFGIYFNPATYEYVVTSNKSQFNFDIPFNIITNNCLLKIEFNGNSWDFIARGVDYVFVGGDHVKFFFINTEKVSDLNSGIAQQDFIKVLRSNTNPTNDNKAYDDDTYFYIDRSFTQEDGRIDANRVYVKAFERDSFDVPVVPDIYNTLVQNGIDLFWKINEFNSAEMIKMQNPTTSVDGTFTKKVITTNTTVALNMSANDVVYYSDSNNGVFIFIESLVSNQNVTLDIPSITNSVTRDQYLLSKNFRITNNYRTHTGRSDIMYQWKHYAPADHRIDPAITNIHDIYVLTSSYNDQVVYWAKTSQLQNMPKPPTSTALRSSFEEVEKIKVASDSVVWHSGDFVPLFGATAREQYQCTFRVVRALGSRYSDDEIRQRVIQLINEYFDVDNWDFGESFYFTELSTYIHQQLATDIASIVIVPKNPSNKFGNMFQVTNEPNELFISTAKVEDVEIVNSLTSSNMHIGR